MSSDADEPSDPEPDRVGPYQVLETLGAGGMGNVYLGRHRDTGAVVAVKVLPPALARSEGFRARFSREIEALERLDCANIVALYDHGIADGFCFYAMEYVAGETLAQRLRRERRIPWQDSTGIASQLCVALKAAHDAGIIHRDLKPSNILLGTDGKVKLTDFGIAQLFAAEKLTVTGGVVGTAEYMSPEQAAGQHATKRSDLYSLGAVLYVMLTGRPPFTGATSVDILQKHRYGLFDPPSKYVAEIPAGLDALVSQLMEKNPDKRLPDAYVLSRRLNEVLHKVDIPTVDQSTTADQILPEPEQTVAGANVAGSATLMRNLLRAELTASSESTYLSRLFDNTFVLVTLLIGVLVAGWWLWPRPKSLEQQFAEAQAVLTGDPSPDWLRIRDQVLKPLIDANPERWTAEVQPLIDDVDVYELESALASPRRRGRKKVPESEAIRQLERARRDWERNDLAVATARLSAIEALWKHDPREALAVRVAIRWRQQISDQQPATENLVDELRPLLKVAGQRPPQEARAMYSAVVELYGDDPRMKDLVSEAQGELATDGTSPP